MFTAGRDAVQAGLVKSLAKPGGRLTGIQTRSGDLIPKRLEILKEMIPKARRFLSFYGPDLSVGVARTSAREAARRLRIDLVERHVRSADELRESLRGLKAGEVDAIFLLPNIWAIIHGQLIVSTAIAKKLPTMFSERTSVAEGGLASYGTSYHEAGRLSAKYVHRVLLGANPADLPIERLDRFELVINLKTAKAIGLTIPQSVLGRADEVIQ